MSGGESEGAPPMARCPQCGGPRAKTSTRCRRCANKSGEAAAPNITMSVSPWTEDAFGKVRTVTAR
jgi:hypothetical protein